MADDRRKGRQSKTVSLDNLGLEMGNKPPQALDVEEAVLGALLVEPNCVDDTLSDLTPACFYSEKNRLIFESMNRLQAAHASIDLLTISQQLRIDGNFDVVGGAEYIALLSSNIGAAALIEFYVKILKQKCIQRELITASYTILKDAYNDSVNVDDLIDTAQSKIYAAIQDNVKNDVQDVHSVIKQVLTDIEKLQESTGLSGCPSGFPSLDAVTLGWQPSDLIIIAARPSVGKTAFVLNVARNAAVDHNRPVAFFSLEMSAKQLGKRLMVSETGISGEKLKGGQRLEQYEWIQLDQKIKALDKAPFYIDETPSLPIAEFRAKAKRLVKQKGVKLIIVDYLQLMQGPVDLRGIREQEVAAISRMLKATAKELNVPIIALSQLSRNAVNRQGSNSRPLLSDLRESGSIEQDADMVLFIHRYDYQGLSEEPTDVGKTELIIAKHRNGALADIPLTFRSSEVRFVDGDDSLVSAAQQYDAGMPEGSHVPISQMTGFDGSPFGGDMPVNSEFM